MEAGTPPVPLPVLTLACCLSFVRLQTRKILQLLRLKQLNMGVFLKVSIRAASAPVYLTADGAGAGMGWAG